MGDWFAQEANVAEHVIFYILKKWVGVDFSLLTLEQWFPTYALQTPWGFAEKYQ
jgi:hypothetical protein